MAKIDNRVKYLKFAENVVEEFDMNDENYTLLRKNENFVIKNHHSSNKIYVKDRDSSAKYTIDFFNAQDCTLYIGHNIKGNINIQIHHNSSLVYIGNSCNLRKVVIDSNQKNDLIVIGNHVTANINNQWRSGLRSGVGNPAIIIGDDCMFATDIVIRNTDAHPIYNIDTDKQVNYPKSLILIEPHVWIGQQVNILKDITIGACSVIALGSIVTKDISRFSIAKGTPAVGIVNKELYWSVSMQEKSRERAKYYTRKYLD